MISVNMIKKEEMIKPAEKKTKLLVFLKFMVGHCLVQMDLNLIILQIMSRKVLEWTIQLLEKRRDTPYLWGTKIKRNGLILIRKMLTTNSILPSSIIFQPEATFEVRWKSVHIGLRIGYKRIMTKKLVHNHPLYNFEMHYIRKNLWSAGLMNLGYQIAFCDRLLIDSDTNFYC